MDSVPAKNIILKLFAPLFLILFLVCPAFGESSAPTLRILNAEGAQLLEIPVKNGFAIKYKHSVALTPVTDYFYVKDAKIFLDKTEYADFGAGLPTSPEGNQKMSAAGGKIKIENFQRELPSFQLRVGRVANHELIFFDVNGLEKKIPLASLGAPGAELIFRAKP